MAGAHIVPPQEWQHAGGSANDPNRGAPTKYQLKGAAESPRSNPSEEKAVRDKQIVELRRHRLSWDEIGKSVGCSAYTARMRYRELMARIPAQSIDEHRAEELVLYDDAVADLMIIARNPEVSSRSRVEAWSTIRAWCERKAKLLGLDAPQQTITVDLVDQEINKLMTEIAKMENSAPPTGS